MAHHLRKRGLIFMRYIICYDISENPVRTRLAKYLESIAWHIQQ